MPAILGHQRKSLLMIQSGPSWITFTELSITFHLLAVIQTIFKFYIYGPSSQRPFVGYSDTKRLVR